MAWSASDIPTQAGRVVVVTGANSGIGLETARALTHAGATVVLACRNLNKAAAAQSEIMGDEPAGHAVVIQLDLSDLESVADFVQNFLSRYSRLDLLINNAGVMIPPYSKTNQGFELQLGTNHLGHFALTLPLLPRLLETPESRVVVVSSVAHRLGRIHFDDLNWRETYDPWRAYGQSKLANLLFSLELHSRLALRGAATKVIAAHPGYASTNLQSRSAVVSFLNPVFGQSAGNGALPSLRAAVDPHAQSGDYYGPRRMFELFGSPVKVGRSRAAKKTSDADRLWTESEALTGVKWSTIFGEDGV